MDIDSISKVVSLIEQIATIIAIIFGGAWTYYNFIKGRLFRSRIEPRVSGKIIQIGVSHFILAEIQLKNSGATKVEIKHEATGIFLDSYENHADKAKNILWHDLDACRVFSDHHWIEPGEVIEESVILPVKNVEQAAYQLRLKVNSKDTTWITKKIVEPSVKSLDAPAPHLIVQQAPAEKVKDGQRDDKK